MGLMDGLLTKKIFRSKLVTVRRMNFDCYTKAGMSGMMRSEGSKSFQSVELKSELNIQDLHMSQAAEDETCMTNHESKRNGFPTCLDATLESQSPRREDTPLSHMHVHDSTRNTLLDRWLGFYLPEQLSRAPKL